MFKTQVMKKVNLFILNDDVKKVSNVLYDLSIIEFFTINKENFDSYEAEKLPKESAEILTLRSAISLLKKYFKKKGDESDLDVIKKSHDFQEKLSRLNKEILHLEDEIKRQEILNHLKLSKEQIEDKNSTIGFIGIDAQVKLDLLKSQKVKLKTFKDKKSSRLYFYANTKKISFKFKEFYLPSKNDFSFISELKKKEQEKNKIEEKLTNLANSNLHNLQQEELQLSKLISTHEAKNHFKKTNNFTVLSGYVPESKLKKFQRGIEKEVGNKFDLIIEEADENAPIQLNNGPHSKKFESLLKLYSLPKYGEIDPTIIFLLAFPIFYGFILGDFGYGLISLIIFTLAKMKFNEFKDFFSILQLSSISSMVWGILYGEYFGFEPYHLFARAQMPETLLLIAVIFGLLHINLGIIFGFLNKVRRSVKKAIYDHLSWIILQIGILLFVLGKFGGESILTFLGTGIFIISLILLYLGHGFLGLIEIPSFFTNVLSYARLMAVGLSSVVIAVLINQYTGVFFEKGTFGILIGIVIFTLGHIFNIVLGNFESFLHSLRLHYVEFFTKFYEGGGKEFEPFGSKLHSLEEE